MGTANDGALLIMSDVVLLILLVPGSDKYRVELRRIRGCVDVASTEKKGLAMDEDVVNKAMMYAKRFSRRLVTLQILTTDLFHWGYNDIILSGPAKTRFIGHVREQIFEKSFETTKMLEEKALQYGVPLEIKRVETCDPALASLEEARRDYDRIFISKEKKKFFPIFEKTIGQHLRKKISIPIVQ